MKIYRRQHNVVARTVAGENLLVPVNTCTSTVFTLNNVGSRLWDELESPQTEAFLAEALVQRYGIELDRALADVGVFLKDMLERGLVVAE